MKKINCFIYPNDSNSSQTEWSRRWRRARSKNEWRCLYGYVSWYEEQQTNTSGSEETKNKHSFIIDEIVDVSSTRKSSWNSSKLEFDFMSAIMMNSTFCKHFRKIFFVPLSNGINCAIMNQWKHINLYVGWENRRAFSFIYLILSTCDWCPVLGDTRRCMKLN